MSAETVVDHLAHIIDTVGEDHASIGSDYDGMNAPPVMPDVSSYPVLFAHLIVNLIPRTENREPGPELGQNGPGGRLGARPQR